MKEEEAEQKINWQKVADNLPQIFREREKAWQKFEYYDWVIKHFPRHVNEVEMSGPEED